MAHNGAPYNADGGHLLRPLSSVFRHPTASS